MAVKVLSCGFATAGVVSVVGAGARGRCLTTSLEQVWWSRVEIWPAATGARMGGKPTGLCLLSEKLDFRGAVRLQVVQVTV